MPPTRPLHKILFGGLLSICEKIRGNWGQDKKNRAKVMQSADVI